MKRKKKKQKKIKYGLPDKIEGFLIGGMIFLLFLADILQNKIQDFGLDYPVSIWAGMTVLAINLFWIAIALYTIFLTLIISRSIWTRGTSHKLDVAVGIMAFIGLVIVVVGAIGAFYFQPPEPIPWVYNIPQITFYHIGMALEVIAGLYFSITK